MALEVILNFQLDNPIISFEMLRVLDALERGRLPADGVAHMLGRRLLGTQVRSYSEQRTSPVAPGGALSTGRQMLKQRTTRIGQMFQRLIRAANEADLSTLPGGEAEIARMVKDWLQRRLSGTM